jgi:hypothetical protein
MPGLWASTSQTDQDAVDADSQVDQRLVTRQENFLADHRDESVHEREDLVLVEDLAVGHDGDQADWVSEPYGSGHLGRLWSRVPLSL